MNLQNPQLAPSTSLPLRYFIFGLLCFLSFGVGLVWVAPQVLGQHHYNHEAIALTHLLVLGWITTIIMGAAIQLVPVALGVSLYSERLARATFIFHVIGVAGMVTSFWFWNFRWVLWFGSSVSIGLGIFTYNIFRTLKPVKKRDIMAVHLRTALFYLALTFLAGQYLMHDKLIEFSPFGVLAAIHAHAHLAVLGWFMMILFGVSYKLVPMFTLSELVSPRRAWTAYVLLNIGLVGLFLSLLLQNQWTPIAAGCVIAALGLWLVEMVAIFRKRKRPKLDAALKILLLALAHLPLLAGAGFWLSWPEEAPSALNAQAQTGYGLLALLGFFSLFIIAILYKILPFLVWYRRYAPLIGQRSVPQLHQLYSHVILGVSILMYISGLWGTILLSSLSYMRFSSIWLQGSTTILMAGIVLFLINMGMVLTHGLAYSCPIAKLAILWKYKGRTSTLHHAN